MKSPPWHYGPFYVFWHYAYRVICISVYVFLILPILVIIPLSFNAQPFFTFTPEMLRFEAAGYSLRWYHAVFTNPNWLLAISNSLAVAVSATLISTGLGTMAALGLSHPRMPLRGLVMSFLMLPLIVPLIVVAAGTYFFYSDIGLAQTLTGIIIAHAVLGTPFVMITVTATLSGFDRNLLRAAAGLGAGPVRTFFQITMPLILPGIVSGALFAFIISFDEPVIVQFLAGFQQRTIPVQMWSGIREQLSPDILAAATMLIALSIALLLTAEVLRRRAERLRAAR
jgi:putative spermidine/putrescine transport system permease protein